MLPVGWFQSTAMDWSVLGSFHNVMYFHGVELLAPQSTPILEDQAVILVQSLPSNMPNMVKPAGGLGPNQYSSQGSCRHPPRQGKQHKRKYMEVYNGSI